MTTENIRSNRGKVFLVGAGPGDPKLITLRGIEILAEADVVVYDRLVHPSILRYCRSDAEKIYVGKESGRHTMNQEDINQLLVEKASQGALVVRLKGGDPFVFGRGGEEAEAVVHAGLEVEIVPGVSSATAVPAYAGIPITHRRYASSFTVLTGHEDPGKLDSLIRWDCISTGADTLVFLMGMERLAGIVGKLLENGRPADTPIALIQWGTRALQKTITGTLGTIVNDAERNGIGPPAVAVVGDVVKLRESLAWFEKRPLFGRRIVITRSHDQSGVLVDKLESLGAEVIEYPVIKIEPIDDIGISLMNLSDFDWIVFTSANGVKQFAIKLHKHGLDARVFCGVKIAAIGPVTAGELERIGLRADFVPTEFVAEALADQFPEDPNGKQILLIRAKDARDVLVEMLKGRGAEVSTAAVYESVPFIPAEPDLRRMIDEGLVDAVTFTSSSTVRNFVRIVGSDLPENVAIACIGPITAETARELGLEPNIIADEYTIDGLVEALVRWRI
jgi:uroporphyrinogen III methyltransferase/synthase